MLQKKEEELLESSDPKHKMIGMLLKARRIKQEEQKTESAKTISPSSKSTETLGSLRQDHCHMYVFLKVLKAKETKEEKGEQEAKIETQELKETKE